IVLPPRDEHRCNARAEGERETQVVEVGERDVAEDPWQVCETPALPDEDFDLAVARRHPTHQPTRKVEEHAETAEPEAGPLRHVRRRVEVEQMERCGGQITSEREHHQGAIVYEMAA